MSFFENLISKRSWAWTNIRMDYKIKVKLCRGKLPLRSQTVNSLLIAFNLRWTHLIKERQTVIIIRPWKNLITVNSLKSEMLISTSLATEKSIELRTSLLKLCSILERNRKGIQGTYTSSNLIPRSLKYNQ